MKRRNQTQFADSFYYPDFADSGSKPIVNRKHKPQIQNKNKKQNQLKNKNKIGVQRNIDIDNDIETVKLKKIKKKINKIENVKNSFSIECECGLSDLKCSCNIKPNQIIKPNQMLIKKKEETKLKKMGGFGRSKNNKDARRRRIAHTNRSLLLEQRQLERQLAKYREKEKEKEKEEKEQKRQERELEVALGAKLEEAKKEEEKREKEDLELQDISNQEINVSNSDTSDDDDDDDDFKDKKNEILRDVKRALKSSDIDDDRFWELESREIVRSLREKVDKNKGRFLNKTDSINKLCLGNQMSLGGDELNVESMQIYRSFDKTCADVQDLLGWWASQMALVDFELNIVKPIYPTYFNTRIFVPPSELFEILMNVDRIPLVLNIFLRRVKQTEDIYWLFVEHREFMNISEKIQKRDSLNKEKKWSARDKYLHSLASNSTNFYNDSMNYDTSADHSTWKTSKISPYCALTQMLLSSGFSLKRINSSFAERPDQYAWVFNKSYRDSVYSMDLCALVDGSNLCHGCIRH